ncbi:MULTISPECIES: PEP-CTERM sorting domain-containing protein [unclassified Nitrosospira]|uniref:PEP-CTERM sorting domain-containing protein n=1 Tax=unclassified Nitrosospira TaxID=2609267 RepID=UPI000D328269|nr:MULTISPECIES: PEP-CTERM sorting domain-containing protein [unclassified Nitrosospira]PTR15598.1 putative secreted protein with PEP-CTERM sorting signal [Nitrosospira sp. Nsp2]WON74970.1 PEP-CTERM sorting domain-containing protein [Nitrosospira sp. Is2]
MNKTITTLLAAVGIAASAPALAVTVGGVDFGTLGGAPSRTHLETATLAQTFVNGNGQNATAYGFITTVNGDNTYCSDGSGNCGLYYVAQFNNSQNFSSSYVEFTSSTVSVFFSNSAPINLLVQDSPTNVATIQGLNGGNPWATLTGHNNLGGAADPSAVLNGVGLFTGTTLSGSGFGLFDVSGPGDVNVINFLNANGILDSAGNPTDIALTSSFNNFVLNPMDLANGFAGGCANGTAAAGAWCYQGTANLRGSTEIPEPGMLALVGIGLLGFGAASRRRKA